MRCFNQSNNCFSLKEKLCFILTTSHTPCVTHFRVAFRTSHENVLLVLLNLCLFERLTGTHYSFLFQKKNIRAFAPSGSIIGASYLCPSSFFMYNYFYYWISKHFIHFSFSRNEIRYLNQFNNCSSFCVKESPFLNINYLKLHRSSWDTFSYLYDRETYGLDLSFYFSQRNFNINRLILSQHNVFVS